MADVHPGDGNDRLKHYWIAGPGRAKWSTWRQPRGPGLMLTLPEIQAELDRVTYRQGWTFTTYQDEWEGPHLLIVAPVPNAYQPEQTIDLGIRSPLPPMPDATYLHRWLAWRLGRVESHECREMLRVGGAAPFDPHA